MDHKTDSERAAFEAMHLATYAQHIARHGDSYKNAHVRCRWEGWKARASLAASAGSEPAGYWDGEFSDVGCALLYEVPQISAFGRQYRNVPLYTHPSPPEGMVTVPIKANTAITCAIEKEVDSQLVASSMAPGLMHRQDGSDIWAAAINAIAAGGGKEAG